MKRRAAVWRNAAHGRGTWWACWVPADLYEPDRRMPLRAPMCDLHEYEDFPTHEAALAHALAEVGLSPTNPNPMEAP